MYRKIKGAQLWIIPNAGHSTVFWQDVAPTGTDFGGGVLAGRIFAETVLAFLQPVQR
jgi:pimeloyl-ACP methyl ester carboxylesterase